MTERDLRTQSNLYNAATSQTMGYHEIKNTAENYQTIMRLFAEGRAKDLSDEPKKNLEPCFITGSGPSLDDNIEKLKDWRGGIICHYSQALTLVYHGIIPDYIVALDSICNWEGLAGVPWHEYKTKLILHPGMWPSLVQNWPNEMLFYRQNLGKADSFGVHEQALMFTDRLCTLEEALENTVKYQYKIRTSLMMFACTPPAQLFVAQVLQYGAVYLMGVDFAYHSGKYRFTHYTIENGEWKKNENLLAPDHPCITTNNGLKTEQIHLYYKKNFLSACRMSMQRVFTTDHGSIVEVPYIDIDKVIKTQGRTTKWDIRPADRAKVYDRYLATIGCYAIEPITGSPIFVEMTNPIDDATGFIKQRNRLYSCDACKMTGTASDEKDHTGEVCTVCKNGKLKRTAPIDLDANIKRIKALVEYCKETA